jgi:hypothetical protein
VLNSLLGCLKQRVVVIGGSSSSLMGRVYFATTTSSIRDAVGNERRVNIRAAG